MIPLGDSGYQAPSFDSAAARISTRVTQLVGLGIVLYGAMALYAALENVNELTRSYELTLGALTVRITRSGFLGDLSVEQQLLGFGILLVAIGGAVVLATTRSTAKLGR